MIDKYFFPRANFKFVALFWSLFIQAPFVIAEPVKIGAMLCLTGSCASDGQAALNGMNLAIKELKLKGNPVEFELLIQDTAEATSGALAVTAYKALYSSGARIFVGPTWSSAGQALAPILARASDVVALTPSVGSPIFHLAGDNLFNLRGVDEQAIKQTAQIAWSLGLHRIAIFGSQQTWSAEQTESFEREFVSLGGEVVSKVEPLPGETDLKSFTLKLLSAQPEAVFISVFAESPIVVKELATRKYQGKKFAAAVLPFLLDQAKSEFEGTIFNTFAPPGGEFAQRYKREFGVEALVASGGGYDALMVVNSAVSQQGNLSLKDKIKAGKFNGAYGEVKFDSNRCIIRQPVALKIERGGIVRFTE